jgi:nucleotide-binding universal stress UspA family protein
MANTRKFLLIGDGSEESAAAALYAAHRANNTGGAVAVLAVIEPASAEPWLGVGETMRREAMEEAEAALESLAEDIEGVTGTRPELLVREGEAIQCIRKLIEEDESISILVLGAAAKGDGPGPLVTALSRGRGLFGERAIPVTVVPGELSASTIEALT